MRAPASTRPWLGWALRALVPLLVVAASLGLLAPRAWPATANPALRATLDTLRAAPVPVLVVLPQEPRETRAQVLGDGYTYTIVRPDSPPLVLRGTRMPGAATSEPRVGNGELRWTTDGTAYTVTDPGIDSPEAASSLRERAIPLATALREQWGFEPDTPLLYLVYLPLFLGFAAWAAVTLFFSRDSREPRQMSRAGRASGGTELQ